MECSLIFVLHHPIYLSISAKRDVTVQRDINGTDIIEIAENRKVLMDDETYGTREKSYHSVEKRAAYRYKFLKESNQPKTLEMLVVVDKHMYHKHGDANITTYTLTLFNMVSTFIIIIAFIIII